MAEQLGVRRVLLKLSGEVLKGSEPHGIHAEACLELAKALRALRDTGIQVGVVIGGGNIFRGIASKSLNIHRNPADNMGMLATMINGIALQQSLEAVGCKSHSMSSLECPKAIESFNWYRANQYLEQNEIVIFVGGTGNSHFTTDTAAALRASEFEVDYLLKATKVDGVYNKDPKQFPDAKRYTHVSYGETLAQKLEVMDATSIALCQSNSIPIVVFDMNLLIKEKLTDVSAIKNRGTLIN